MKFTCSSYCCRNLKLCHRFSLHSKYNPNALIALSSSFMKFQHQNRKIYCQMPQYPLCKLLRATLSNLDCKLTFFILHQHISQKKKKKAHTYCPSVADFSQQKVSGLQNVNNTRSIPKQAERWFLWRLRAAAQALRERCRGHSSEEREEHIWAPAGGWSLMSNSYWVVNYSIPLASPDSQINEIISFVPSSGC